MSRAKLVDSIVLTLYKYFIQRLVKAFGELEENHKAVLGMIKKSNKTAKQHYDKIVHKKNVNYNGDSNDNDFQKSDQFDNSATNSEDIPVN